MFIAFFGCIAKIYSFLLDDPRILTKTCTCAAYFEAKKLQMIFCQQLKSLKIFKRLSKTLIRLRVCAC